VLTFYHFAELARPHALVDAARAFLAARDVRGRVYVSRQGVNAQCGGARADALAFVEWLRSESPAAAALAGLRFSLEPADGHVHPRLRLKFRPNLVSLAGGMGDLPVADPAARATPLAPAAWRRMLAEGGGAGGRRPLVLDVRNGYEWDAGHFAGVARPAEAHFAETPTEATPAEVPAPLAAADADAPVMMYCTGGIRCDVYSTYLRKKGYTNLYTLEGGVQAYLKEEGAAGWNGSLFVFDGRMAVAPPGAAEAEAAAPCAACGGAATLPHANCANVDCNRLFIACGACRAALRGCCCEACTAAPRLLRAEKAVGLYGTWIEAVPEGERAEATSRMRAGRGEGRALKRRRKLEALREREAARRALQVERQRLGKAAMAALEEGGDAAPAADAPEARLARLRELRELRERLVAGRGAAAV
jgi:predicted sulfurtransferase